MARSSSQNIGLSRYSVQARDQQGNLAFALLDTKSGNAPPLELRLQRAVAIELGSSFPATTSYTVTALDGAGLVCAAELVQSGRDASLSLVPGEYVFEIHGHDDQLAHRFPVTVGSAPVRIDVP